MVVLNLTGLPRGVERMKVEWNIECAAMKANISSTAEFSVESTGKFCNIGTFEDFCSVDEFSVDINVFILALLDRDGRELEAEALYSLESVLQTMHAMQTELRQLRVSVHALQQKAMEARKPQPQRKVKGLERD